MSDVKRLRVGIIGLGIGRSHIEGWRQHPQVDVVALTDADPARLAAVGEQYAVAARYTDALAMLAAEKLDVVSICTPNKFHKELTLSAFEAGCHVLCEKPMAMNAAEGRLMLAAGKKAGKRLMINFSYRFQRAASRGLKTQVDSGLFGEFYFGRTVWHRRRGMPGFGGWFGTKALAGGGPLIDLGVHRLDLALWLMGYPKPTWVMGNTYDPIARRLADAAGKTFDVEDLAAAFIRFESGATLAVEASWAANIQEAELMETRLLGTEAGLLQKNIGEGYQFEAYVFNEQNGAQIDMHLHAPTTPAKSGMHDYAQAILTDTPHPASGEEGLVVMELLDAIYESARTGAPVQPRSAVAAAAGTLPIRAEHRRARWATRVQFAALGVVGGVWGSHIPSLKAVHGLSEFSLSMVLLAGAFGAISALFFAGRLVATLGARRAVLVAGGLMCGMFSLLLVVPGLWAALPVAFAFGCGMSVFDVSINSEGSELESVSGPIMSNLHGMFSVGAMSGATLASALLHAGIAPALQLGGTAAMLAVVMLLASFGMLEVHASAAGGEEKAHFAWPRGLLLMIGLLIFTGMIAEGVMADWCVLYLKQDLGMPQAQAALGLSAFAGAMALSRFGGDYLRARYPERQILFIGASLAAVSMAVVLIVGVPWVALIGFALVGAGVAPVAPILFNAATRVPGVSRAAAIASVTSVGYSGFMVGPPLIGAIAQATSLTVALSAVVVGAVCLAIGARKVPTA